MKTYQMLIEARKNGALGIRQAWNVKVEAETGEKALLKLYDEFEHIKVLKCNGEFVDENKIKN